jgi:hypothetical protein
MLLIVTQEGGWVISVTCCSVSWEESSLFRVGNYRIGGQVASNSTYSYMKSSSSSDSGHRPTKSWRHHIPSLLINSWSVSNKNDRSFKEKWVRAMLNYITETFLHIKILKFHNVHWKQWHYELKAHIRVSQKVIPPVFPFMLLKFHIWQFHITHYKHCWRISYFSTQSPFSETVFFHLQKTACISGWWKLPSFLCSHWCMTWFHTLSLGKWNR